VSSSWKQLKVVVPVSGGKDSQACLKLALQNYEPAEVLGIFCDTQFEHPSTYEHVEWMMAHYGARIETLCAGSVEKQVLKHGRFPSFRARFCTEELKIWPAKKAYAFLADLQNCGFEVWYGMRTGESDARAKRYAGKVCDEVYAPHEFMKKYPKYLHKLGVSFRLPVLDWTTLDVLEFLDGEENPLYGQGFDRVGCFPCLAGGDEWKEKAFSHDAFGQAQAVTVLRLEQQTGKSVWTSKGGIARNAGPGCSICSM
jgi:3'-phosphoadenosine 5'-phosphosulfate sulfotransferase (PAPS reductase)/FAD synthetase